MTRPVQRDDKRSGRLLGLGGLAALVVLAMLYLGDCMPGFGTAGSSSPATNQPAAPQSDAAPSDAAPSDAEATIQLTVDGDRCSRTGATAQPCDDLCRSVAAESKTSKVLVNGTLGTHAAVDGLRRCLAQQGLRDVVVRTE